MKFDSSFQGADLVEKGLKNLKEGKRTVESLLVLIGGPRLRSLGFDVPHLKLRIDPELSLYRLLRRQKKLDAHSLYNSYIRRLVSFEHAVSGYNLKTHHQILPRVDRFAVYL